MANPVVHFEIGAADDQPLLEFYGELFGWGLRAVPGVNYTLVDTRGGGGINGGIGRSGTGEAWATFYVEVDDPQAFLDRAEALGATTVLPATEIRGWRPSRCSTTPTGCWSGWCRAKGHPRRPSGRRTGTGRRSTGSRSWAPTPGGRRRSTPSCSAGRCPGGAYGQVGPGAAHGIGGGIGAGGETRWATVYASVGDVEAALARAEALGATRVYGPNQVDDHTETGAFRDPGGNVFGVYHHGPH